MTKNFLTFGILTIILVGVFVPTTNVFAAGPVTDGVAGFSAWLFSNGLATADIIPDLAASGPAQWIYKAFATGIAVTLMKVSSIALILSGKAFDWIVEFSIIKMATNIGDPAGVGGAITVAWATLRDVANMCFIFVLLFAAFKAMFDTNFSGFQSTVKNIIIVALLINFSLFFSKVVIDASNIVSVGFYNSIIGSTAKLDPNTGAIASGATFDKTISAGYMNMLRLQTFYDAKFLDTDMETSSILVMGIMSSVFMLITAVILLIASIMFATRFIILIFLMILSPLALIAFILPGQSGKFKEWREALVAQSFFAPIYFALTWVVFKLGTSLLASLDKINLAKGIPTSAAGWSQLTTDPKSAMALVVNYILIIGFSIAALVISKSMASKTKGFKEISGGIGTVALGGTALAGRQTFGRVAGRLEKSQTFQRLAANNPKTFGALYSGTQKAARGSFDVRASDTLKKVPGLGKEMDILGTSKRGQGGFEKYREDKTKRVIDKGKQFTDRRARADYARRVASKIGTHLGSTPGNETSLFGTMGRSNRMAAATLLDERIKELGTNIGSARSELNGYLNQMGITGPGIPGPAPTVADLRGARAPTVAQRGILSAHEQRRLDELIDVAINPATGLTRDSIDGLNMELTNTRNDRTTLGLTNTLRQQF